MVNRRFLNLASALSAFSVLAWGGVFTAAEAPVAALPSTHPAASAGAGLLDFVQRLQTSVVQSVAAAVQGDPGGALCTPAAGAAR